MKKLLDTYWQLSRPTADKVLDEFLREIAADFELSARLDKEVSEALVKDQSCGSVAETTADEDNVHQRLLALPKEVREWTDVVSKPKRTRKGWTNVS